ncbi:MAG: hypothetical protein O2825_04205, partial [Proteobacteria bacterium]|nr:hypothetical protein [Pseudomonadota bacterium]
DPRSLQDVGPADTVVEVPAGPAPTLAMDDLLQRAGIDIVAFSRLSQAEQQQVLRLAEQLDSAEQQAGDPA